MFSVSLGWMKRWIVEHHRVSEAVSTNVQGLFNFLPGRYDKHELWYEAALGVLNAAMTLEDLVVHSHVRTTYRGVRPGSEESKLVGMVPRAGVEAWLAAGLSLLRSVEVACEMAAWRLVAAPSNEEARWKVVRSIEATKTVLKLGLLVNNRGRLLERHGHPPRSQINQLSMDGPRVERVEELPDVEEREEKEEKEESGVTRWAETAGEVLYIARPLIYLHGAGSWRGWLQSLAVDGASRLAVTLLAPRTAARHGGELARRRTAWLWYLLRPPMWEALKSRLSMFRFLSQVPLLGYFFQLLHDMLQSLSRFYFFTSAS